MKVLNNLGYQESVRNLIITNNFLTAIQEGKSALELYPNDSTLNLYVGAALALDKQFENALPYLEKSLSQEFNFKGALNKAECLRMLHRYDEAIPLYHKILEIEPDNEAALFGISCSLFDTDQNALPYLEKIKDTKLEAGVMYAESMLALGNYEIGWKYYQKRLELPTNCLFYKKPILTNLTDAKGKHVLLMHEQGYGDSIQYMRYITLLKPYVGKLSVLVPDELKRLYLHMDPTLNILDSKEIEEFDTNSLLKLPYYNIAIKRPERDYELPIASLPFLFGTTLDTIPNKPYLKFEESFAYDIIIKRTIHSKKLKVGVCYAGSNHLRSDPKLSSRRNINPELFQPILQVDGVTIRSLQYESKNPDETCIPKDFDFYATARRLIFDLDLVISVDTSVAHLAAAMGKRVWMLSRHDACWRWMRNRSDTPWYPSMTIYRQKTPGDWVSVIDQVKNDLESVVNGMKWLRTQSGVFEE